RGKWLHGQTRCTVLASDEWRMFDIGYTNHHCELLPLICYNHALFHGLVRISMLFVPWLTIRARPGGVHVGLCLLATSLR
ncbi:hypothetical protein ZWY2020_016508, partial [Hordeum vulgare]